jgi:hypothetical protein
MNPRQKESYESAAVIGQLNRRDGRKPDRSNGVAGIEQDRRSTSWLGGKNPEAQ